MNRIDLITQVGMLASQLAGLAKATNGESAPLNRLSMAFGKCRNELIAEEEIARQQEVNAQVRRSIDSDLATARLNPADDCDNPQRTI